MKEAETKKQKGVFLHPERLIFYREIGTNPLINLAKELSVEQELGQNIKRDEIFYRICSELVHMAECYQWQGNLWKHFLSLLIAQSENTFSRACAWSHRVKLDDGLMKLALHDLRCLKEMWDFDFRSLGDWVPLDIVGVLNSFTYNSAEWDHRMICHHGNNVQKLCRDLDRANNPEQMYSCLLDFYRWSGYGKMGMYSSFRWKDGGLRGISYPDPVTLGDLIGYEYQKEIIIKNTEAFVQGKKANNILLYGERGTGKSSTIKALVNEYDARGLRLVEITKAEFSQLPSILQNLREYPQRFLVFIDDLSFESNETEYKYLKYILEGGMEIMPDNTVIYATSNRRHLVRENWHDRDGGGEVRVADSVSEKLSLADRFGITVTFTSPDQEEYLEIVEGLAKKSGLDISKSELREKALQWERWHNSRSGRTAKQFINSLLSQL